MRASPSPHPQADGAARTRRDRSSNKYVRLENPPGNCSTAVYLRRSLRRARRDPRIQRAEVEDSSPARTGHVSLTTPSEPNPLRMRRATTDFVHFIGAVVDPRAAFISRYHHASGVSSWSCRARHAFADARSSTHIRRHARDVELDERNAIARGTRTARFDLLCAVSNSQQSRGIDLRARLGNPVCTVSCSPSA